MKYLTEQVMTKNRGDLEPNFKLNFQKIGSIMGVILNVWKSVKKLLM